MTRARFDPDTGAYVDGRVTRGFPLGGIGSGGFSFDTDGSFGEFRWTNNWMCPVRGTAGSFHAVFVRHCEERSTVLLRRPLEGEYGDVRHIRGTRFVGRLPAFTLEYEDTLPIALRLEGFTPHVPHDVRQSTLPAATFRFVLTSRVAHPVDAAVLFSLENILGRGGTGHLGVELGPENEMQGVRGRVVYDDVSGNTQAPSTCAGARGVRFRTGQRWDDRSHRCGVVGEYLLLADETPGVEITVATGWDASSPRAAVLDEFARDGRIASQDGGTRPAAAVAARTTLAPGRTGVLTFTLAWWMPDHVTEPGLARHGRSGGHDGVRVGHVYETHFPNVDAVAAHVLRHRHELEHASTAVPQMLEASTLPDWLVRAIVNSIDSVLCNTVVPADGTLYTLEGVDWHWPMGGLTGTMDQRLAAHPYTATFFPHLDLTELEAFRQLADARGAIPHGNGNCDLGLGTTEVPYGWPLVIKDFLPATEWTDLTMSFVLQVGRHWRVTGDDEVLRRFWPALTAGAEYLHTISPAGVPEGGTTYDVWEFPGTFAYTATLYLATLRMLAAAAAHIDPTRRPIYERRHATAAGRLDALWDPRGYFRSTETRDTLFTAALAGDWAARWIGLDPVVPVERAASHARHAHRVLAEAAAPGALPRAEARLDGSAVEHPFTAGLPPGESFNYVWQVLPYQAMEAIYVGLVAEGLATIRRIYDRLWADGHAWSGGLRANGESIYMTHPAIWAVLHALTGAALDVPARTLHLVPRWQGRCPIFFPGFWAMVDHDERGTSVEVVRHVGAPVHIARVVRSGNVIEIAPILLVEGTRLRFP